MLIIIYSAYLFIIRNKIPCTKLKIKFGKWLDTFLLLTIINNKEMSPKITLSIHDDCKRFNKAVINKIKPKLCN